jgi:hypothetical protein
MFLITRRGVDERGEPAGRPHGGDQGSGKCQRAVRAGGHAAVFDMPVVSSPDAYADFGQRL